MQVQRELEKIVREMLPRDEARKSIQRRRSLLTKRTESSDEMPTVTDARGHRDSQGRRASVGKLLSGGNDTNLPSDRGGEGSSKNHDLHAEIRQSVLKSASTARGGATFHSKAHTRAKSQFMKLNQLGSQGDVEQCSARQGLDMGIAAGQSVTFCDDGSGRSPSVDQID